jgi:hypothetical protein
MEYQRYIKILGVIIGFLFVLIFPTKSFAFSGTGSGTDIDPYVVMTCEQLQEIQDDATGYYVLGQDVDCSDTINWNSGLGFLPIGGGQDFWGVLDGMGFTIYDLYIDRPEDYSVGLFHTIEGGIVGSLTLERAYIRGYSKVGALVSNSAGGEYYYVNVVDSSVIAEASSSEVGGLIGYSSEELILEGCTFEGIVTGNYKVGGIVGYIYGSGDITDLINYGSVSGKSEVGGLVGYAEEGVSVTNSHNTGEISGYRRVGGIVGYSYGNSTITNSYNLGVINGYYRVGGLVGSVENQVIIGESYNEGNIYSFIEDYEIDIIPTYFDEYICVGGLVGAGWKADLEKVYNEGNIQAIGGSRSVGGLIGCGGLIDIQESYNVGDITTQLVLSNMILLDGVGGLLGIGVNGIIKNSYNTGSFDMSKWESTSEAFEVDQYAPYLGGLAGVTIVSDIENSYSNTSVDINDIGSSGIETAIGGLIGAEFMEEGLLSDMVNILGKPFVERITVFFLKIVNNFANLVLENYSSSYEKVYVGGLIGRLNITFCEGEDCDLDLAVLNNSWWSSSIVRAIGLVMSPNGPSPFDNDESADHYERAGSMDIFKTYSHKVYNTDPDWDFDTIWSNVYDGKGYPVLGIQNLVMPSAPVSNVASGTYSTGFNVSLSSTGSSSIRYTVNGSVPTCSTGTVYTTSIPISVTSVIRAVGCIDGIASSVSEFTYVISQPQTETPTSPVIDTTPSLTTVITRRNVTYTYIPPLEEEVEEDEVEEIVVEEKDDEKSVEYRIRIVDNKGNVLAGAKVIIEGREYLTDENGEVVIQDFEKGEYIIRVIYDGKEYEQSLVLGKEDEVHEIIVENSKKFPWWVVIVLSSVIVLSFLYKGINKSESQYA